MKFAFLSIVFTSIVTNLFSQWGDHHIKLSDKITTESKSITGFDKIEVGEDFVVHISYSDQVEKVEIEANENLHEMIKVEKNGKTLKISTKSYSCSGWNNSKGAQEHLVANITVKKLAEIKGYEDVAIVLEDKIVADDLTISLFEDSTLEGVLEVQNFVVQLNEDSSMDIEGSASTMKVEANEDSTIQGFGFVVDQHLAMVLKEDSKVKLTVNGDIDLRAKEDSYFTYKGNGNFVNKRLTGDSAVRHW